MFWRRSRFEARWAQRGQINVRDCKEKKSTRIITIHDQKYRDAREKAKTTAEESEQQLWPHQHIPFSGFQVLVLKAPASRKWRTWHQNVSFPWTTTDSSGKQTEQNLRLLFRISLLYFPASLELIPQLLWLNLKRNTKVHSKCLVEHWGVRDPEFHPPSFYLFVLFIFSWCESPIFRMVALASPSSRPSGRTSCSWKQKISKSIKLGSCVVKEFRLFWTWIGIGVCLHLNTPDLTPKTTRYKACFWCCSGNFPSSLEVDNHVKG